MFGQFTRASIAPVVNALSVYTESVFELANFHSFGVEYAMQAVVGVEVQV